MGGIEDIKNVTRKPKFVKIPSVPQFKEDAGTGSASSTTEGPENKQGTDPDEPDRGLMAKLGIFLGDQRQVKTTTYIHPTLNNASIGRSAKCPKKKMHTTSPASTLSDKGIGSSLGSFDSEFRHDLSVFQPHRVPPYDPNKTGSLDSRTQEIAMADKSIPAHTRSSSDIICQSGPNEAVPQGALAEQSSATLWNADPRRHSKLDQGASPSTLTSSIRPRIPSSRRRRSRTDSSGERDSDITKLPQLCRDSLNRSAHSSVSSSVRSISTTATNETPVNKVHNFDALPPPPPLPSYETTPSFNASLNSHIPTASSEWLHALPQKGSNHGAVQQSLVHTTRNPSYRLEENRTFAGASNTLTGRTRLASDGAVKESMNVHTPRTNINQVWSRDLRRETHVPLKLGRQNPLTSAIGMGLSRAESVGVMQHSAERYAAVAKLHGSTSALLDSSGTQPNSPCSDDAGLPGDERFKRQTKDRSSTRSNPGERRKTPHETKVRFAPFRPPEVILQSLQFELPLAVTSESKFIGREWLFNEMQAALNNNNKTHKGVVILGETGHGKTSVVEHLVSYSYHGWRNNKRHKAEQEVHLRFIQSLPQSSPLMRHHFPHRVGSNHSSRTASPAPTYASSISSRTGSQTSLTEEVSRKMASQIVAFHFCQADNNTTCYVPEFLHSIAAQLTQVPQLTAYRELLINDPHLQNLLNVKNCIQNPSQALKKAILEPLIMLKRSQKLPKSNLVIIVDGLNEAELHRPDYGFSILSFLQQHLSQFPDFIKVVATCRSEDRKIVENLPVHFVSLDGNNDHISRDMQQYVSHRVGSSTILSNLTLSGKSDPAGAQKQLSQHLLKIAKGNFLYLRMTLDLIDQGAIVPKSAGFKVVPMSLHEVFLLQFNLRFKSSSSFDEVRDVISVALASLYPLKDEQLYQAVCCGLPPNQLSYLVFKQRMDRMNGLLVQGGMTGGRVFFHPYLREWLTVPVPVQGNGTLQSSNRFKIDVKLGYSLLAGVMSRQPPERLHKHATLELAHHVLKAGMYKNQTKQNGISASDKNAILMANSSQQLTEAFVSTRNLFFPNIKVSKLLLRSGADPNVSTEVFYNAPPLAVVAHTGCLELAEILLMYRADVNTPATNGMSALTFAAAAGQHDMVELLLRYQPVLSQVDINGHTPLLHAISRGYSTVAKLLLSRDLYVNQQHHSVASEQALVAAATIGDTELIAYLLDTPGFECEVNALEPRNGESPLTSAAAHGKSGVCEFLISRYRASLHYRNRVGLTPLLCAVKHGEWDTADLLLNCGAPIEACDPGGKTPLMVAASQGHLGLLELLLTRGANVNAADKEGLTALGWSALQGHAKCLQSLIGRSDIHHCDNKGRTALDLAAFFGDLEVVDFLLNSGADVSHVDTAGMCALDRAIGSQNTGVVSMLLKRGGRIQATSWAMAVDKTDVTTVLLNHSLEEGNILYKDIEFDRASQIYGRALKHVGELSNSNQGPRHPAKLADICAHLLLGYSRCLRKIGDIQEAEASATRALELKPHWYEALYVRARVLREDCKLQASLRDAVEAERAAPPHIARDIKRLVERIKEEIRTSGSKFSRSSSASSEINIPHSRTRLNSSSSYHGKLGGGPSPGPWSNELSRSYQPQHQSDRLDSLPTTGNPRFLRRNSQENLTDSMISLTMYPSDMGSHHGSVRRVPRTNPHWRPHVPNFHRSTSEGNGEQNAGCYGNDTTSLQADRFGYTVQNGRLATPQNAVHGPLVTDL